MASVFEEPSIITLGTSGVEEKLVPQVSGTPNPFIFEIRLIIFVIYYIARQNLATGNPLVRLKPPLIIGSERDGEKGSEREKERGKKVKCTGVIVT